MSVGEKHANDALRVLDETHRLFHIERDEYRRRRRQLLESLGDAVEVNAGDTLRRALPANGAETMDTAARLDAAGEPEVAGTHDRRVGTRRGVAYVLLAGIVAAAAVICWFLMTV